MIMENMGKSLPMNLSIGGMAAARKKAKMAKIRDPLLHPVSPLRLEADPFAETTPTKTRIITVKKV